ncbi:hypothetical protein F5Y16DRAFT_374628 [Xylariaceae sp. FL0255]|nr:hypothetical protein F5Y16DRAFT_374628 [Xylariaceae sp. FL0255]
MAARPASHPRPFDYQEPSTNHLPLMDEDDVAGLEAVIKALAQGRYPRLESVPNALNAYNCDRKLENGERKAWSYFHLIADFVRPADARPLKNAPRIDLDHGILDDLKAPWPRLWPIRAVVEEDSDGRSLVLSTPASYRFICFIHRHKICIRQSRQKDNYLIEQAS